MNGKKEDSFFIPKKLAVGFNKRSDTYTGKIGYVIYYDAMNKLRKEASWNSWRDQKIDPLYVDNEPIDGFVLNKRVGGERWSQRMTFARIFDPRGFEIEISIDNLLYILNWCNTDKKEIKGKLVYSYYGTELVLLPANSTDYIESKEMSEKMFTKNSFKEKDLVPGTLYRCKGNNNVVYIGKVKLSTEFDKKYVSKLAFVSVDEDTWLYNCHNYIANNDNDNNRDYSDCLVFKSASSIIAEIQQDYFSKEKINDYLHRFSLSSYSFDFWHNLSNIVDKFVPDHECIKNNYKSPYTISYDLSDKDENGKFVVKDTFRYEGTRYDRLKIVPEWFNELPNSYSKSDIIDNNVRALKSIISPDGKSVLIQDFIMLNNENAAWKLWLPSYLPYMYDFMEININTGYKKICDPGHPQSLIYKSQEFPNQSEPGELNKAISNKKDVVISDNRSFLYYITKDGYISSSLQEQIANNRIIKFGYSNGIKANAWNIPSAIQLPMKLPN